MKTIYILATIVIILSTIFLVLQYGNNKNAGLVGSGFISSRKSSPSPSPTLAQPDVPKTFQFDSSTDLGAELKKVNPQVLDSDFE